MEINKVHDITGVITTEDIVEGRCVLLTTHPGYASDVTGRLTDEPGVKLPDTQAEAARATYALTWPVDNRTPPLTIPWVGPYIPWALRAGGFDQATNLPLTSQTVYMTYPGYQENMTIPSGNLAIGLNGVGSVFTIPSGQYVYSANLQIPGTRLRVCDTATDGADLAGRLVEHTLSGTALYQVERFNTNYSLTVGTL